MNLYKEILVGLLEEDGPAHKVLGEPVQVTQLVEMVSYQTLKSIKHILEDETLTDSACFMKIEEIIRRFEELGSNCGKRHGF